MNKYKIKDYNIRLVLEVLILTAFGIVVIGSQSSYYAKRQIIGLIIGFVVMGVLTLFIKYTKLGKAMRAVPEDKVASTLVGINVNKIITTTFAIGAGLAAVASMMYTTSYVSIKNELGISLGLKAFVAAVLGGIGSIPGAMIGGLLLGIVEILVKVYMLPGTYEAVTYLILIFVLLVKPTGLLGKVISEKV